MKGNRKTGATKARADGTCKCGCRGKIVTGDRVLIRNGRWFLPSHLSVHASADSSVKALTAMDAKTRLAMALATADEASKAVQLSPRERRLARMAAADRAVDNEIRKNLLAYGTADRIE